MILHVHVHMQGLIQDFLLGGRGGETLLHDTVNWSMLSMLT